MTDHAPTITCSDCLGSGTERLSPVPCGSCEGTGKLQVKRLLLSLISEIRAGEPDTYVIGAITPLLEAWATMPDLDDEFFRQVQERAESMTEEQLAELVENAKPKVTFTQMRPLLGYEWWQVNGDDGSYLGRVEWGFLLHHYIFRPTPGAILSPDQLTEIGEFCFTKTFALDEPKDT